MMNNKSETPDAPWTTCFLTRMLITHLKAHRKEKGVDYNKVLGETYPLQGGASPMDYLLDNNNWVPHAVLQRLMGAAEQALGSKDMAYDAARRFFPSNNLSLVEIIATYLSNVNQVLYFSNLWAGGYTNYLRFQCIAPVRPECDEATVLAQFNAQVTPRIGNFQLIRGCYEGIAQLFDYIQQATCVEEISQLRLDSIIGEFDNYHLERYEDLQWRDWVFIIETASKQEVAALKKADMDTEIVPIAPGSSANGEGLVCEPFHGNFTLFAPREATESQEEGAESAAYRVMHPGVLQKGEMRFHLRAGQWFDAPYSRYRFSWTTRGVRQVIPPMKRRSEIIPLLLNHVRELRETHQRLLQCFIENQMLRETNQALKITLKSKADLFGVTGKTPIMQRLFEQIRLIAPTDATVLICGETGAGKEILAHAIHRLSLRREKQIYTVNCAALAEGLLEAELFGYEKGAFTGAHARQPGIFETANGGTVFLDEIGECSSGMQAKLLRVLEAREIQRVGSRQTLAIDVRTIAATNRVLEDCVNNGTFRRDLFFRLNVIALRIPPLRERSDDLPFLVDYFLDFYSHKYQKQTPCLTPDAMALLSGYHWPGNVRQLKNEMERLVVYSNDPIVTREHLRLSETAPEEPSPLGIGLGIGFHEAVDQYKRTLLERILQQTQGNQTEAADRLGLQRTYFVRLMRQMGLPHKRI